MSIELSVALIVVGIIVGATTSYLWMDRRNLERRLSALEDKAKPEQKRWSHNQLDQIERVKFLLGRHIAERTVADEFLKSLYRELGEFYSNGPNDKQK